MRHPNFAMAALALALLLFLLGVQPSTASPILPAPAARAAAYTDIPSFFNSVYKVLTNCPNTVRFGDYSLNKLNVALLQMSAIQEDATLCSGPFPMNILSEANTERPGQLKALGLPGFRDALDQNENANNLIKSSPTSMLVGWHAGERVCGTKEYPLTTIYFIIKEANPFSITFRKPGQLDLVTIPPKLRSLLIVAPNDNICLLVDRSSSTANPTLKTTFNNGTTSTTILTSSGPSPAPTSPNQSANPSPGPSLPPTVQPSPSKGPPAIVTVPDTSPNSDSPSGPDATAEPTEEDDGPDATETPQPSSIPSNSISPDNSVSPNAPGAGGNPASSPETDPSPSMDESTPGTQETSPTSDDTGSACFPAPALVTLPTGNSVKMSQLSVGDRVLVAANTFSNVILFTHRSRATRHTFLRITVASGRSLIVSPGHYIYVGRNQLHAAESIRPGDALVLKNGLQDVVRFVEYVSAVGLYNPQTVSGDIIVDGFRSSTYTTAVHPKLAHSVLMSPVRWLYSLAPGLAEQASSWFDRGSPVLARLLPNGPASFADVY